MIRRIMFLLCGAIGAAVSRWFFAGADPPKSTPEAETSQLESLRKERRETLRKLVDVAESKYNSGNATLDCVLRASELLLEAEIDMADTTAERIAVREKLVTTFARSRRQQK